MVAEVVTVVDGGVVVMGNLNKVAEEEKGLLQRK